MNRARAVSPSIALAAALGLSLAAAAPARAGEPGIRELGQRSLDWLGREARKDGSFEKPAKGLDSATRALALEAFLRFGHTHRYGVYKKLVQVLKAGVEKGVKDGEVKDADTTENQIAVASALAHLYGISRDNKLKQAAQEIVDKLVALQKPDGGFAPDRRHDSEVRVTVRAVIALQNAKTAGLEVREGARAGADGEDAIASAKEFLLAHTGEDGAVIPGEDEDPAIAAAALPVGLVFAQADRALAEKALARTTLEALDLEGLWLHLHGAHLIGQTPERWRAAWEPVEKRLYELARRDRGEDGGASLDRKATPTGTAYVALIASIVAARDRLTAGGRGSSLPRDAILNLAAIQAIPDEADRTALVDALAAAGGDRKNPAANEVLAKHWPASLHAAGEMLTTTDGPCAEWRAKEVAWRILGHLEPPPPDPNAKPQRPLTSVKRNGGEPPDEALPFIGTFLETNPPYPLLVDMLPILGRRLGVSVPDVQPDTPWKERQSAVKAIVRVTKKLAKEIEKRNKKR